MVDPSLVSIAWTPTLASYFFSMSAIAESTSAWAIAAVGEAWEVEPAEAESAAESEVAAPSAGEHAVRAINDSAAAPAIREVRVIINAPFEKC